MVKFSIIIPVYNVENYIDRCLKSVSEQTYKDYEVIIINDGSTDKSIDIAKKYPYKIISQKNQGLSAARNRGVTEAKGEYLLFLDSDDYWEKDLLKELAKNLKDSPDVVRFQIQTVDNNYNVIKYEEKPFTTKSGKDAFSLITKYHFVETAWCYAYKRSYFLEENFKFKEKTFHEDFGLIPLVIMKASKVKSISYVGYDYYQRTGSIMNNTDYEKTKKKVKDLYAHYLFLIEEIDKTKIDSKIFKSFIANSAILKICELKGRDYKEYKRKLKKDEVYDNILTDTFSRKVKFWLLKVSPKIYHKLVK